MESTNRLDSATSQACVRDGHHSSRRDTLECGAPGGGDEGRHNGDVAAEVEMNREEEMRESGCDEAAGDARTDAQGAIGRRGRVAQENGDGRNGAAMLECALSDDGSSGRGEATQRSTREAPPLRSWPAVRAFDWKTPCVVKVAGSGARVGQALGRSLRRGERRRGDRTSRDAAKRDRSEKRRALTACFERRGQEKAHALQGTVFALNKEEREAWLEKVVEYWSVLREGKRGNAKKKPRLETVNGGEMARGMNGGVKRRDKEWVRSKMRCHAATECCDLRDLIEKGIVETGEGVIKVVHDNVEHRGDLTEEGQIHFGEHVFASPNEFALFVERRTTPFADRDDAWKRVVVSGRSLDEWRTTLISDSPMTLKAKEVSTDSAELDDHS